MTTRHFVLDAGRHAIQVLAFCCVVAVLTQTIWPQEAYSTHLVKSLSIGLVIWLVIEFGRLLVPQRHCYPGSDGGHGWPRGWLGGLLAAVGTSGGLLVGAPLGDWLTGTGQLASLRDRQVGLLITIAAGAVVTYYFYARGRAAALEAGKAAAERDASQARLMLLQSQLEPHMLFNTLANLRALIGI
ncbi:MAG TPA: histidine kinase, partial [Ottowia sp.]|nr:histidine kinase [Ottowia sp.]